MDHLSLEMQLEIYSYLSLNQLAHCRLVSHAFKAWAEAMMRHITHLEVPPPLLKKEEWDVRVRKKMKEDCYRHTLSKPSVTALPRVLIDHAGSEFYAFLGKFCPNLQVLRTEHLFFSVKDMVLLASKLQFFACKQFSHGESERTASSLLDQFPNLEGFTYSSLSDWDLDYVNSINDTLRQLKGGRIKCLRLLESSSLPLPQSLSESLIELSVDCLPTVEFCPFPLPNLRYLTIDTEYKRPAINSTALASAPNLRYFAWRGSFDVQHLKYSMNFNQLRVLHLSITFIEYDGHERRPISLPTSLEKLTFNVRRSLVCFGHSSTSLKYLVSRGIASFSLVCPNLKVLVCDEIELDPTSLTRLVHSLSHSVKLAKVSLVSSNEIHESVSLQPLIDALSSITGLTHLKLSSRNHSPSDGGDGIDFDQKKFPSLVNLDLNLPGRKIVFHLTDSFTSFKVNRYMCSSCLELEVWDKVYSVYGHGIKVVCGKQLDNLAEVTLDQSRYRTELRLVQSKDTCHIHDSHCFPLHGKTKGGSFFAWLGLVSSRVNSAKTEAGGGGNEEAPLDIILPPHLKQLDLHLVSSLNSLRLSSPTLRYLSVSHVRQLRLDLPSLREIQLQNWFEPLDATLATQLGALTSMSFRFVGEKEASVAVIESHLKTASEFKQLTTLKFSNSVLMKKLVGPVRVRQEDFPFIKRFSWDLPVTFVFSPGEKFTEIIHKGSWLEFCNEEQGYEYKFNVKVPVN